MNTVRKSIGYVMHSRLYTLINVHRTELLYCLWSMLSNQKIRPYFIPSEVYQHTIIPKVGGPGNVSN